MGKMGLNKKFFFFVRPLSLNGIAKVEFSPKKSGSWWHIRITVYQSCNCNSPSSYDLVPPYKLISIGLCQLACLMSSGCLLIFGGHKLPPSRYANSIISSLCVCVGGWVFLYPAWVSVLAHTHSHPHPHT